MLLIFLELTPPGFPVDFIVTPLKIQVFPLNFGLPPGTPTTFTTPSLERTFHLYPQQGVTDFSFVNTSANVYISTYTSSFKRIKSIKMHFKEFVVV